MLSVAIVYGFAMAAFPAYAVSPLALSCLACHSSDIDSVEMPALSRLTADRIVRSLRASRDAPATGSIMARFAKAFSDADIDQLAADLGRHSR